MRKNITQLLVQRMNENKTQILTYNDVTEIFRQYIEDQPSIPHGLCKMLCKSRCHVCKLDSAIDRYSILRELK